jgi:hypothetical protein
MIVEFDTAEVSIVDDVVMRQDRGLWETRGSLKHVILIWLNLKSDFLIS